MFLYIDSELHLNYKKLIFHSTFHSILTTMSTPLRKLSTLSYIHTRTNINFVNFSLGDIYSGNKVLFKNIFEKLKNLNIQTGIITKYEQDITNRLFVEYNLYPDVCSKNLINNIELAKTKKINTLFVGSNLRELQNADKLDILNISYILEYPNKIRIQTLEELIPLIKNYNN